MSKTEKEALMDTNKMREQFEAWAKERGYINLSREQDGSYKFRTAWAAWEGWQASREAVVVELPSFEGYKDHIVRELQAAFSGAIERQGLKVAP